MKLKAVKRIKKNSGLFIEPGQEFESSNAAELVKKKQAVPVDSTKEKEKATTGDKINKQKID